jgi:hypothetical protein
MTTNMTKKRVRVLFIAAAGVLAAGYGAFGAPTPEAAPGAPPTAVVVQGGGGRGRGGLPGATPEQLQAVADMNASLGSLIGAVAAARTDLATITFTPERDPNRLAAAVEKVRVAELALALGRAAEFAKLQAGPHRLNADQVTALVAAGGVVAAGRGGGGAPVPVAPPAPPPPAGRGGRGN